MSKTTPRVPETTSGAARQREILLGLSIVLATFLAFSPAFGGGWVFDDHLFFEKSGLLSGPLWRIWFSADPLDYWPLTYTTFWLEWRGWGAHPLPAHLANAALHGAAAVLLWRVLRRLAAPGAWLAGLLFAVHPVTVESVAWISERKNVLSGALFAGSLLAWLRWRESGGRRPYLWALGLFLLALLAKTSTVMLPPLLLWLTWWRDRRVGRRDLVATVPFFTLSLCLGLVTVWFQSQRALLGAVPPVAWGERLGRSAWALAAYLQQAFVPVNLALVYPPWPAGPAEPIFWLPLALVLIGALALAWWRRRESARAVMVVVGSHALLVLPVIGLVEIAYFKFGPISNHLQYLAVMGPVALLAAVAAHLAVRWPAVGLAPGIVLAGALGLVTAQRATAYHDDLSLWRAAWRDSPQSLQAAWMYADRLAELGRSGEARGVMEKTAATLRDPVEAQRARALLLAQAGRAEEAIAEAEAAEAVRPTTYWRSELGWLLTRSGHPEQGVRLLAPLVAMMPRSIEDRYRLGSALTRAGRVDEAIAVVRESCRLAPTHGGSCVAFIMLLSKAGRLADAPQEVASALGVGLGDPAVERTIREALHPERRD